MAKKKTFRTGLCVFLCILLFVFGLSGGAFFVIERLRPESDPLPSGDISVHFIELGNAYTGDCTYIKAGDTDILIDAGSRTSSIPTIAAYLEEYVTDGVLEYVIVTHAHQDHYAGFATGTDTDSLFDLFSCETIIDFALTNQDPDSNMYSNYVRERGEAISRGATHYTAQECMDNGKSEWDLGAGITLTILDSYYYDHKASTENDYSVCCLISQGDLHYLFTGDLEEKGEEYLVEYNDLPQVALFKAGHHGSKTSTTDPLLRVIRPEIVCVCCCCGSAEYTDTDANQFPTQDFIDRVAPYTDAVYVTTLCVDWDEKTFRSMNGNIVVSSTNGTTRVECSASDLKLKETEWFRTHRDTPDAWVA